MAICFGAGDTKTEVSRFASASSLSVSFNVPNLIANSILQICLHFIPLEELSRQLHHSKTEG